MLLHLTRKERDDKYDSNQLRTDPLRPNQDDRKDIDCLEQVQKRAMKLVSGFKTLSYEDRLRTLKLTTLE